MKWTTGRATAVAAITALPACAALLGLEPGEPRDAADGSAGTTDGGASSEASDARALDGPSFGDGPRTELALFSPSDGKFYLFYALDGGPPARVIETRAPPGARPVAGIWTSDGGPTVGYFDPAAVSFTLLRANETDAGTIDFKLDVPAASYLPLAGDFDGDGVTSVGVYDADSALFHLRLSNDSGPPDVTINFGSRRRQLAVAGDWNGDRAASIGLYDPVEGVAYLRDTNDPGPATYQFRLIAGTPDPTLEVVAGDWFGNGRATLGAFDSRALTIRLFSSNEGNAPETLVRLPAPPGTLVPVAARWAR